MISENFVILGAIIATLGGIEYLVGTFKGKVKPNRVTFFLWSLTAFIAFFAQIKQGVGIQSLLAFLGGLISLLILLASFLNKKAYW